MLCVTLVAVFFAYRSSEYARVSSETARTSVLLQSAQLRPQLQYGFSKVATKDNAIDFAVSVFNDGPLPAVIGVMDLPVYSDGKVTWYLHFFEQAVIPKGQRRESSVRVPRTLQFGDKTVNLLEKLQKDGGLSVEVRYTADGLPEQTYYDSKKILVQFE